MSRRLSRNISVLRHATRDGPPPGRYAHEAPRLIGYAILLLALLLLVIGSMLA